jgi:hypothetical protein
MDRSDLSLPDHAGGRNRVAGYAYRWYALAIQADAIDGSRQYGLLALPAFFQCFQPDKSAVADGPVRESHDTLKVGCNLKIIFHDSDVQYSVGHRFMCEWWVLGSGWNRKNRAMIAYCLHWLNPPVSVSLRNPGVSHM